MTRTAPELAHPASNFRATPTGKRLAITYDLGVYSGTPGWELGWIPHVNNGTQPNRGYQNRPLRVQRAPYTADLRWNRVLGLGPSGPGVGTLPLGHCGPV
ncbi:hypothetical protein AVEN_31497-1 [Araneus ventricosus]|uniref:Uncharacterized protein n=1 Tax=Araneus ventricosus TaxID=182803 RepID=A0A4Y2TAE7_ARAVE|nr:hypothetical protein AVEN_31497-1 [Araneus ventricosus]